MRCIVLVVLVAACSGRHEQLGDASIAGLGGSGSDCGASSQTLFDTATVPPAEDLFPARLISGAELQGFAITTTEAHEITCLGAHAFTTYCGSPAAQLLVAVVPLDPTTQLPKTDDLSDAVGAAAGTIPCWDLGQQHADPAPETPMFPTSFSVPAGTWGVVVGAGRLGIRDNEANLPLDLTAVGSPPWFHFYYDGDVGGRGTWAIGSEPTIRMIVVGE